MDKQVSIKVVINSNIVLGTSYAKKAIDVQKMLVKELLSKFRILAGFHSCTYTLKGFEKTWNKRTKGESYNVVGTEQNLTDLEKAMSNAIKKFSPKAPSSLTQRLLDVNTILSNRTDKMSKATISDLEKKRDDLTMRVYSYEPEISVTFS